MSSLLTTLVLIILVCAVVILMANRNMNKAAREEGARFRRVGDGLKELHAKMNMYSHLTEDLLKETEDEKLLECVLSNLWSKMRSDLSDAGEVLSSLSFGRNLIYSIYAVTGGLKQEGVRSFMKGKDSAFLPVAARALETLEAFDAKDRLEEIRQGLCTSSTLYLEAFDALDVKSRMVSYIRSHPREFID